MDPVAGPGLVACCAAIAGLPRSLFRPTPPDRAFLASLTDAGLPRSRVTVSVRALRQVPKPVPTAFIVEGVRQPWRIPNAMTAFVVRHPRATFVVDPGICRDVVTRAIAELPLALRVVVKPPSGVLDLMMSLEQAGLAPSDVDFALPTHLHWDHVAGLLDMPDLAIQVHAPERAWAMDGDLAPVGGVRAALRDRPLTEFELEGPPVATFTRSHDLFGDGSVVLIDLAGHTPGSIGVLLNTVGTPVLLAGDAAWHSLQIEHVRNKASYPGMLADEDRRETFRTLHRLHAVRESLRVVPTHDHDAARTLG